jgi:hypothetical protein
VGRGSKAAARVDKIKRSYAQSQLPAAGFSVSVAEMMIAASDIIISTTEMNISPTKKMVEPTNKMMLFVPPAVKCARQPVHGDTGRTLAHVGTG